MMIPRARLNGHVNRIKNVGIELEGGWDTPPRSETIHADGSVKFPEPIYGIDDTTGKKIITNIKLIPLCAKGEVVSRLLTPVPIDGFCGRCAKIYTNHGPQCVNCGIPFTLFTIDNWVRSCYPHKVNHTCGLHVHMSFYHRLNYSRLMTPDFGKDMISALREFGTAEGIPQDHMFWNRLNPSHPWTLQHCDHTYLGDGQVNVKSKDYHSRGTKYSRYTAINYPEAQHHTVEVRILPMFEDVEVALKAIWFIIDRTNGFLGKVRQKERSYKVSVSARPEVYQTYGKEI